MISGTGGPKWLPWCWRAGTRHLAAVASAAVLVLVAGLTPQVALATTVKSPPCADSFGAKWVQPDGNGLDTRAAALWMKTKLGTTGYSAFTAYGVSAYTSMAASYAQSDAVWAMFGHGNGGFITQWASATSTVLHAIPNGSAYSCSSPHACLSDYSGGKISKMKLMVFGGCHSASSANYSLPYDQNLGNAAIGMGVDSALGFGGLIYWPPIDKWSEAFFGYLAAGKTVSYAAANAAVAAAQSNGGNYGGTDMYQIFGNQGITIVPAGYGS